MTNFSSDKQIINVLLADDHQMILDGLAALISSENKAIKLVGLTSDSERIIPLARELNPDVILLDLDLGTDKDGKKVSGIDLLPHLARECKAKVLILTGESDVSLHAEAISRGAKGVVLKNAPGEVIIQAVKKIAAGQRWHSDEILDHLMTRQNKDKLSDETEDLDSKNIATLTPMQLRVIATITANVTSTNKQIANLLRISEHTLKNHLTEINSKLYTKNKMDLFMFAKRHNLDKFSLR